MTPRHAIKRAALVSASIGIACIVAGVLSSCELSNPVAQPSPAVDALPRIEPSPYAGAYNSIDAIVAQSSCKSVNWPHRGTMPLATLKGIVRTFQTSVCAKRPILTQAADTATLIVKGKKEAKSDVFSLYPNVNPTLPNLYALTLHAVMMESSGDICEGRDTTAGAETSTTAESGLLQQSANIQGLHPALKAIVAEYQAHPERCYLSTFRSQPCSMTGIVGDGPGADFQRLMRSCPGLATEQAALAFRVGVRHFGPARRGELTFNQGCADMFSQIQKVTVCQ